MKNCHSWRYCRSLRPSHFAWYLHEPRCRDIDSARDAYGVDTMGVVSERRDYAGIVYRGSIAGANLDAMRPVAISDDASGVGLHDDRMTVDAIEGNAICCIAPRGDSSSNQ